MHYTGNKAANYSFYVKNTGLNYIHKAQMLFVLARNVSNPCGGN